MNGGDKEYVVLPNGKKRSFKDLISHTDEITQDISTMKNFKVVRQLLETFEKLCLKSKKIQLDIDLLEIYGKVKINSLDIYLVNESGSINSVGIGNLNIFFLSTRWKIPEYSNPYTALSIVCEVGVGRGFI